MEGPKVEGKRNVQEEIVGFWSSNSQQETRLTQGKLVYTSFLRECGNMML